MKIYEISDGFAVNLENVDVIQLSIAPPTINIKMKNSSEMYYKGFTKYQDVENAYNKLLAELKKLDSGVL